MARNSDDGKTGEFFAGELAARGYDQASFARAINVSKACINHIIKKPRVSRSTRAVRRIAHVLGLPLDLLPKGNPIRVGIGANVARAREAAGLDVADLAEKLRMSSPDVLRGIESGIQSAPADILVEIAQITGVSVDELYHGHSPKDHRPASVKPE
jgi:transcriptional regulator with XRE-family HTH domain